MPDQSVISPQERGLFAALKACRAKLARLLGRIANRQDDDALQDAFRRAYETPERTTLRHPRAFLLRTGALNFGWRAGNRNGPAPDELPLSEVYRQLAIEPADAQAQANRRFTVLGRALGALPEQCRRVLILKKVHGLSQAEIAERLGITPALVEQHLATALLLCRDYLEAHGALPGSGAGPESAQGSPRPRS